MNLIDKSSSYMLISSDKIDDITSVLWSRNFSIIDIKSHKNGLKEDCIIAYPNKIDNNSIREDSIFLMDRFFEKDIIVKYSGEDHFTKISTDGSEDLLEMILYDTDYENRTSYLYEGLSFSFKEKIRYSKPKSKDDLKIGMIVEYHNKGKWVGYEIKNPQEDYDKLFKLLIKYDKVRINENEYTKLATHFMDDMDKEFKFFSPNDDIRLIYCNITFPDGVKMRFSCRENLHSDTETFTLSKISGNERNDYNTYLTQQKYLNLYGDKIQFDNFNTYRRIRLYMNRQDLFGTNFDGYIYDSNKLGNIPVVIEFDKSNQTGLIPRAFLKRGIFKQANDSFIAYILDQASLFFKNDEYLTKFRDIKESLVHDFLEALENEQQDRFLICDVRLNEPNKNIDRQLRLISYLYLYCIFYKTNDDVLEIITNPGSSFDRESLIVLLYGLDYLK